MGVIMVYYSGVDCSLVSGKGTGFLITVYSYIHNALAVTCIYKTMAPKLLQNQIAGKYKRNSLIKLSFGQTGFFLV